MSDTQTVQRESTSTPTQAPAGPQTSSPAAGNSLRGALRGASYAEGAAMLSPLQMKGGGGGDGDSVQRAAADGIKGGGGAMPYKDQIQQSFGGYDISNVQAHQGPAAQDATSRMGAAAYATGNHVAFGKSPDLHTAAHEAAHVVQQKAGVSLKGGVGQVGDKYEQHADQVADAVVQGKSAEPLLAKFAGGGGGDCVQMKSGGDSSSSSSKGTKGSNENAGLDKEAATAATRAGKVDVGTASDLWSAGTMIGNLMEALAPEGRSWSGKLEINIPIPLEPGVSAIIGFSFEVAIKHLPNQTREVEGQFKGGLGFEADAVVAKFKAMLQAGASLKASASDFAGCTRLWAAVMAKNARDMLPGYVADYLVGKKDKYLNELKKVGKNDSLEAGFTFGMSVEGSGAGKDGISGASAGVEWGYKALTKYGKNDKGDGLKETEAKKGLSLGAKFKLPFGRSSVEFAVEALCHGAWDWKFTLEFLSSLPAVGLAANFLASMKDARTWILKTPMKDSDRKSLETSLNLIPVNAIAAEVIALNTKDNVIAGAGDGATKLGITQGSMLTLELENGKFKGFAWDLVSKMELDIAGVVKAEGKMLKNLVTREAAPADAGKSTEGAKK